MIRTTSRQEEKSRQRETKTYTDTEDRCQEESGRTHQQERRTQESERENLNIQHTMKGYSRGISLTIHNTKEKLFSFRLSFLMTTWQTIKRLLQPIIEK